MVKDQIAISCMSTEKLNSALALANQLNLNFIPHPESVAATAYTYLLLFTTHHLCLYKTGDNATKPFYIDFLSSKMLYRIKHAGLRKEALARAMGMHPREHPIIIDGTAGLGRDSFILAALGFEVTLLERSPIIYALLSDAFTRAKVNPQTTSIMERMHLIHTDSVFWLQDKQCDIVYLDPMFPQRQKSASVKKEMVILQDLLEKDLNHETLFNLALSCATHRVVVKRPRLAENITNCTPNFSLLGKKSRFDIYLTPTPKK